MSLRVGRADVYSMFLVSLGMTNLVTKVLQKFKPLTSLFHSSLCTTRLIFFSTLGLTDEGERRLLYGPESVKFQMIKPGQNDDYIFHCPPQIPQRATIQFSCSYHHDITDQIPWKLDGCVCVCIKCKA